MTASRGSFHANFDGIFTEKPTWIPIARLTNGLIKSLPNGAWLRLAHEPASLESKEARQRVLLKYNRAIRSYVGALLQNDDDADEQ